MRSFLRFILSFFDALKIWEMSRRKCRVKWKECMVYEQLRTRAWSCEGELCLYICVHGGNTIVENWKGVWILS